MKRVLAVFTALALGSLIFSPPLVQGQGRGGTGNRVKDYRKATGREIPNWVKSALKRANAHLKLRNGKAFHLRNAEADLTVFSATEDDNGFIHIRLDQVYDGVPVYGGQLMVHLDSNGVQDVTGRFFEDAYSVKTKPCIRPQQAIEVAKQASGYTGKFRKEPEAELVILPNVWINGNDNASGATLTYRVELWIEDGTEKTGRHQYFVDANDAQIVFKFNAAPSGVGSSLYSGRVNFPTTFYYNYSWGQMCMECITPSVVNCEQTIWRTQVLATGIRLNVTG